MSYDKAAYEAYLNSDNRTQASKNVITITNGMSLKGDSEKEGKLKLTATGDGILNIDGVGTISLPTGDVDNTGDAGDIRYNNTDDIFQGKKSNGEWQTFGAGSNLWQESTNSAIYYNAGKISIGSSTEPTEKLEVKDGKIKTYGTGSGFVGDLTGDVTGDVTGTVSSISNHTTDNLSEGSNNLYFTDTRARSSISINKLGGLGSLDYNIPAGIIDYTGPTETEIRSTISAGTGVTLTDGEIAIGQSVSQSDDVSFNKLILTSDLSGVDASFNNAFIGSLTSDSIAVTNLNLGGADLQTTLDTKQDKLIDGLLAGNNVIMDPASANDGDIARFKPDGLFGVSIGDLSTELGIPSKQDTITSSTNLTINDISANDASFNNVKATKFIGDLTGTVSGDVTGNSGTVSIISNHSIDGLSDIDTTGKINGSVLKYNSTSTKWEVGTDSSGIALTDLSVTTATASSTPALSYDNANGQFTYTPPSIPDITTKQNTITSSTDLVLNDISANDISANNINANDISANDASFNNVKATKFIGDLSGNINGSSATVTSISTHSISNLSDISLNSTELFDGGVLKYNATTQVWKIAVDSLSSDGSGIALTSLSVQQALESETPALAYNNQNGVFTYTPPNLSLKQNKLTASTDIIVNDISANDISANDASFNNVEATKFIGDLTGTVSGDVTGNSATVSTISNHTINSLSDVDTAGKINGSVLKYNTTSTKWEVGTDSGGIAFTDLSVTTATSSSTPSLTYDNANGQFTYTPPSIPDITTKQNTITSSTDLVLNDISANDIIVNDISANDASFNNLEATNFIGSLTGNVTGNVTGDVTGTVSSISTHSIGSLSDVSISAPSNGNVLKYNSTTSNWEVGSDLKGIAYTDLSLTTDTASLTPSLVYNNTNGQFTYTPPDLSVKQNTLTTSTNITVNDISANDISANDVSFNNVEANQIGSFRMNGHIIPTSNANFDLGNAEYKIRHLFLSDNSLWIGDDHKIDISGGELRFKKRNKKRVPKAIIDSGIDVNTAINGVESLVGKSGIENFTLNDWYKWARQSNDFINNAAGGNGDVNNVTIDKIFQDDSNFIASGNDNKKNLNRLRNRIITVTVKSKTSNHPHHGQGSGQAYYFDDVESPIMEFIPGVKYIFNQEDSSNTSHPLRFYKNPDKSEGIYDFNVTITGTPGNDGAKTVINVSENTLSKIFYQCESHEYMGNVAFVKNSKNIRDISGNNAEFNNLKITSLDIDDNKIQQSKIDGLLDKIADIESRLSALEG